MGISQLIKGSIEFKENEFLEYKDKFDKLIDEGQRPKVLFIGCSDSRVVPNLITKSDPGDLFIIRNIGNFIPPFSDDEDFHGTAAAIEYAVSVLEVDHIIVCGHSYCGAIASLYKNLDKNDLKHVKKWLELGEKAKQIVDFTSKEMSVNEKIRTVERVSVIFQAENLLTYPKVKERVKMKKLHINIWFYKIETGEIEEYDSIESEFKVLGE